jgi:hypothetical protein
MSDDIEIMLIKAEVKILEEKLCVAVAALEEIHKAPIDAVLIMKFEASLALKKIKG